MICCICGGEGAKTIVRKKGKFSRGAVCSKCFVMDNYVLIQVKED